MERSKAEPSEGSKVGADFLQLDTAQAPHGELAGWLTGRLRLAIAEGRLPVGSRLPATRALAGDLDVSRGVITEAYRRLMEEGHVAGRGRNGTVVVAAPATVKDEPPRPATKPDLTAEPDFEIFDKMRAAPARIDLTPGRPDLTAFPRTSWLRAERSVLHELRSADLGYGDPRGAFRLREVVAGWLARNRGISADPNEIVILSGVAQAMVLLGQVLVGRGTTEMAVEDPGSLGARQHLRAWGVDTPPVPVDSDGIRVDRLRSSGARAILLTPAHQFPTGVVLGGERRRELVRWARDGGLILEDDYDAEHRYDRAPVPALRALLADRVCYAGSVSKLLAPALRIGWMLPAPGYMDDLVAAKRFTDLGNATLPQLVLAELMASGEMERHLRFLRRRHRRNRDAMLQAIATHLPGATVHGAAAGLHLTITLPAHVDDTGLAAAALDRGVKVQPLSWHRQLPGPPGLVLGYAASRPGELIEGITIVGQALTPS